MKIEIFDVEHGQCALVTADDGNHMLIDCGHNATTGWRPSAMLAARGIRWLDTLAISNCDEDHVSDLPNIARHLLTDGGQTVNVGYLHHNFDIGPEVISKMKAPHALSVSMRFLCALLPKVTGGSGLGFRTFGPGTCNLFLNRHPSLLDDPTEQGFSNNMSLVTFLHHGDIHIVFPGDLEPKGWRLLLANANFQAELARVNVFVAPHHGRSTGYLAEVFGHCRPKVIIVSDGQVEYDTQTGVYGRQHAAGLVMFPGGPGGPAAGSGPASSTRLGDLIAGGLGSARNAGLGPFASLLSGGLGPARSMGLRGLVAAGSGAARSTKLGDLFAGLETRYVLTTRRDTSRQYPAIVIEQQPGRPARVTTSRASAAL